MATLIKRNRIKLIGLAMVFATLCSLALLVPTAADADPCLPNCGSCAGCTIYVGAQSCTSVGGGFCYYGTQLLCHCDGPPSPNGNCYWTYNGTC